MSPTLRLALALYPFALGAMAVNAFFASLLWHRLGLPVLTPPQACLAGALIALPASWAFARHIRGLIAKAGD